MSYRALRSLVVTGLVSSLLVGTGVEAKDTEFDLPLFKKIWAGTAVKDLPKGMPDPQILSRKFESQPRMVDWATKAEGDIERAISHIEAGKVSRRRIRCHQTICEVVILIPEETVSDKTKLANEIAQFSKIVGATLDKEATMAIGGGKPGVTGVLAYFHEDGEGVQ